MASDAVHVSVGVFFLSSFFLTASYNTTFAFDRPVDSAVLVCFFVGAVCVYIGRYNTLSSRPVKSINKRLEIPLFQLEEIESPNSNDFVSPILGFGEFKTWKYRLWCELGLLLSVCCLRVELFRRISLSSECTPAGYSYAIPLLVSVYDYWRNQRSRPIDESAPIRHQSSHTLAAYRQSCYDRTQYRGRGIVAALLVAIGGYAASSFLASSQSTYICPLTTHGASSMRTIRFVNVILDSSILVGFIELGHRRQAEVKRKGVLVSLGVGLIGIAVIWTIIGCFVTRTRPEQSAQLFLDMKYVRSTLGQVSIAVLLILSSWHLLSYVGILGITIMGSFVLIYFPSMAILISQPMSFPYISISRAAITLALPSLGSCIFLFSRIVSGEESKSLYRTNIILQILLVILCGVGLVFASSKLHLIYEHPIDVLTHEARAHYDQFIAQAASSDNLGHALMEYRRRYNQHPPPGFDKWYQYATSRSSVVIDDFDSIYNNLLPFWAISPDQLRSMTHQLATNPFNDLGAISIRNGTPQVQEGIKPTHAWMVHGAAKMIQSFSEHLPDMDIVLNLNDEPRVAVPWERITPMNWEGKQQQPIPKETVVGDWSINRQGGWGPISPPHQTNETVFTDGSWRGVYDTCVSLTCPPSSRVRTQRIWNRRDLCLDCAEPHSLGQFPLNFDVATDICHQPDLAFLHGLLISPSSFKVSQDLVPIFSQSAISGFNDILFPSPWNYMDKVKYAPSDQTPDLKYEDKENSLYWVGSTSEGYSRFGEYRGMPRQRLSHLVNNNTQNQVSVLLPDGPLAYRYRTMDGSAPAEQLNLRANVHLLGPIARCGDCDLQRDELGTGPRVDFQSHWSHRYLVDLDGAGFSGRFLPFLQSHSLPFRTGLFRQWFDERMISWLHFVPVDIRLHGLWSTLAYFAGVSNESTVNMDAHTAQGMWIAEQGRKWSEVALRKEDMEIYFFRLLLEWGRLTDDKRDVLGYN
ncbi:hypothetical protein N7495_005003 [Penicillium taxi]|uniref:uncharacterized protein n=1 Tax=Penicillium taxi TaxID=168475 RepID=UPI002544EE0A|nr:uncharacterized protein N7495_005003 [Penicillium taxi]KAJ5893312.1 hypothetical protein N7495_005003 [Penicillium taxi]